MPESCETTLQNLKGKREREGGRENPCNIFSKFIIMWQTTFRAVLGYMWPIYHRLAINMDPLLPLVLSSLRQGDYVPSLVQLTNI